MNFASGTAQQEFISKVMVEYLDDYDEAKTVPAHIAGLLLELDFSSG